MNEMFLTPYTAINVLIDDRTRYSPTLEVGFFHSRHVAIQTFWLQIVGHPAASGPDSETQAHGMRPLP
jgi:hypothetical protein